MVFTNLIVLAMCQNAAVDHPSRGIVELVESLQSRVRDFRCEFEGSTSFTELGRRGHVAASGSDGLHDVFSGTFIWKANGDTHVNVLHRTAPDDKILREQLVIRTAKNEAENYWRHDNAVLGVASIDDPDHTNADRSGGYGQIFVVDILKRLASMEGMDVAVAEESIDGRDLKVVSFSFSGINQIYQRFWLDLERGGHAVRRESYAQGGELVGRTDIELGSFQIEGETVWMPVGSIGEGHVLLNGDEISYPTEPTSLERLYVNDGTMQFNRDPGPEVFKIDYKPGTPITDNLKQMEYEFGQQQPPPRMSKADAEAALLEQVAAAEKQKSELVAAPRESRLATWLTWVFGATTVGLVVALVLQRRQR